MQKLLLAGLAGAAALTAATPAQAHPNWHYRGGCGFFTISDGTDSPQTKWDGEIDVVAVATDAAGTPDPTASISVQCELRINGATPGTIVFSCSTPGTGFVACAGQFSFNADPDDIVSMCDIVTVNGEVHKDCGQSTQSPIVPQPVQDALDQFVWPTVDPTIEDIDEAITGAEKEIDELICPTLADLAGGPADQPPVFDIRTDGDIFIDGELFWNCPPYESSGD